MSPAARGHLAMLVFSGLVAGSFSLGARIAHDIDPAALNALRFAIAAALLGLATAATTGLSAAALRAPWRYAIVGTLISLYFVLMFEGLKSAPAISSAAVFTLSPLLAAGFGWLTLRQRLTRQMALALAVGGAGALWVIFRGDLRALLAFQVGPGERIFFLGCAAYALHSPLLRRLNRGEPAVVFIFLTLVAGTLAVTLYGWGAIRATDWAALPGRVWATLLYISVASGAATFFLMQFASMRLPSAKVMAYTYLVPTWVILWELALGGSPPRPVVAIGVAMSVIALLLLLRDDAVRAPAGS
ncbi:DMT family transporter [Roseisalinus antarcticus]|uniref:EamA-like transporter family protein n=1 Tax=Roseisalinus antarcticus TaxID=254357 RepID=A0A1Y5SD95_9RHOB|nr:DMT family transporter [Roseisalinus antarcticus]SLN36994.1 EamA-like transporter family protein [Roseisalinus antarcticus]